MLWGQGQDRSLLHTPKVWEKRPRCVELSHGISVCSRREGLLERRVPWCKELALGPDHRVTSGLVFSELHLPVETAVSVQSAAGRVWVVAVPVCNCGHSQWQQITEKQVLEGQCGVTDRLSGAWGNPASRVGFCYVWGVMGSAEVFSVTVHSLKVWMLDSQFRPWVLGDLHGNSADPLPSVGVRRREFGGRFQLVLDSRPKSDRSQVAGEEPLKVPRPSDHWSTFKNQLSLSIFSVTGCVSSGCREICARVGLQKRYLGCKERPFLDCIFRGAFCHTLFNCHPSIYWERAHCLVSALWRPCLSGFMSLVMPFTFPDCCFIH